MSSGNDAGTLAAAGISLNAIGQTRDSDSGGDEPETGGGLSTASLLGTMVVLAVLVAAVGGVAIFVNGLYDQSRIEPAAEILANQSLATSDSVTAYSYGDDIHIALADNEQSFIDMTLQPQATGVATGSVLDDAAQTYDLGGGASVVWSSGAQTATLLDPVGGVWHMSTTGGESLFDRASETQMGPMLDVLIDGGLTGTAD